MSGRQVHLFAAAVTAVILGALPAAAADINVIYGCCTPPQAQASAADGYSVVQNGVTIIYGRNPQLAAYVPRPMPEPYYVVDQGPSYEPPVPPYNELYDYPYIPLYGYPGYRPLGAGGYHPYGHRRMRRHGEFGRPADFSQPRREFGAPAFHGMRPHRSRDARVIPAQPRAGMRSVPAPQPRAGNRLGK